MKLIVILAIGFIIPIWLLSDAWALDAYSIDKPLIIEHVTPGQTKPLLIKVTNNLRENIVVSINKSESLENYVHINMNQMEIPANETRSLYIAFYSLENDSRRVEGNITFLRIGGVTKDIKVSKLIIDIEKPKEDYAIIRGLDQYKVIKPGDSITIGFDLGKDFIAYNFSAVMAYYLLNQGGEVMWTAEDRFWEYSRNISVTINIPPYISDGNYKMKVNVFVNSNLINTTTQDIQVVGVKSELRKYSYYLIAVAILLTIVIILELRNKKLRMEKELFLF
jgi:hypothetical protein